MSPVPGHAAPPTESEHARDRKAKARQRAAVCHDRLRLASDALAAADLLLGLNWSVRQCGAEAKR